MGKCISPVLYRVKCNVPTVAKQFQQRYQEYLQNHNIFKRAYIIQRQIEVGNWNNALILEYKELRKLRLKGIMEADYKCHKLLRGEVLWSRTIQIARDMIALWSIC